jgi:aminomethyltransferase
MLLKTPFHDRVAALNETQLWSHWAGYLVVDRYQMSEKFEYFAIRNTAGIFDASPLFKYHIRGSDAERYLAGVMARDVRTCKPGRAQYQIWCDDRGFVIEDGVLLRTATDEFFLTSADPNLAYLRGLIGHDRVEIDEVTDDYGIIAFQGPKTREILAGLAPEIGDLGFFHLAQPKIAKTPTIVSRTGYTGDLGYEIWVGRDEALGVWDAVMEAGRGYQTIPFGQIALLMARIEAGLILIRADFESSRYAFNDEHCSTPIELGFGWMFKNIATNDRPFIGREAIRRELAEGTSRWNMVGLVVDWREYDERYRDAGLIPPKDHLPVTWDMMVYDADTRRVGYATSYMYSPMLQRHIAIARVHPELATPGARVNLEVTINHRYELVGAEVARLPLYNPERKTA